MLNNKNDYTLNEQGTPISGSFISKATILKSSDQQINREQAANVTDVKDTAILHLGSGRCRRFGPWRWPFLTICVDKICVYRHFFLAVVPFFFALRREPGFLYEFAVTGVFLVKEILLRNFLTLFSSGASETTPVTTPPIPMANMTMRPVAVMGSMAFSSPSPGKDDGFEILFSFGDR